MEKNAERKSLENELLSLNRRIREVYYEAEKELLSDEPSAEKLIQLDLQALELKELYAEKEQLYLRMAE